uniref:TIMELESS-interacting protein n=1 Tax=Sphaeramia orbicularis TaxID=375764 RepID=A0A673B202_9TELE
ALYTNTETMEDLPDYSQIEDESFPPLPPPDSPGQGGQDNGDPFANGDEDGEVSKLADVPVAKKKGVKRPQPKLDSQRYLKSDRGLPALRTLFEDVRFKGKGHEAEDLHLLMQKMENWAHRLYPKLQFEDFIDKVEKLGSKKEVQTCLKRIRLDMPLTHDDFIGKDGERITTHRTHPILYDAQNIIQGIVVIIRSDVYIHFRNAIIEKPWFRHSSPLLDFFQSMYIHSDGRIKPPVPVIVYRSCLTT